MEKYRSEKIKNIIAKFPSVEKILEEYGIGCDPSKIGICQLKDILEIHKLPGEAGEELMRRIEATIYPERNLTVTFHSAGKPAPSGRAGNSGRSFYRDDSLKTGARSSDMICHISSEVFVRRHG